MWPRILAIKKSFECKAHVNNPTCERAVLVVAVVVAVAVIVMPHFLRALNISSRSELNESTSQFSVVLLDVGEMPCDIMFFCDRLG